MIYDSHLLNEMFQQAYPAKGGLEKTESSKWSKIRQSLVAFFH
jgi:hypothetical protein